MVKLDWLNENYESRQSDNRDSSKILTLDGKSYMITQNLSYHDKQGIERIDGLHGCFYNERYTDNKDVKPGLTDIGTILEYNLFYKNEILRSNITAFETISHTRVPLKGIGSFLFQYMMETILAAHEFLTTKGKSVKEIKITGWLSLADKTNGNWRSSVPFYQHRAEKYKMDFKISSDDKPNWEPEEFIEKSDKDGNFVMTFSEETEPLIIKFSIG